MIRITIRGPVDTIAKAAEESRASYPGTLTVAGTSRGAADPPRPARHHPRARRRLPVPAAARDVQPAAARRIAVRRAAAAEAGDPLPAVGGVPAICAAGICHLPPLQSADPDELPGAAGDRSIMSTTAASRSSRGSASSSRISTTSRGATACARRRSARASRWPACSPADAGRVGVFEYMIGNLDWAMQAGPAGRQLLPQQPADRRRRRSAVLVPVPYDWDFSGLVDAPYATAARRRSTSPASASGATAASAATMPRRGRRSPTIRAQQAPLLATFAAVPRDGPQDRARRRPPISAASSPTSPPTPVGRGQTAQDLPLGGRRLERRVGGGARIAGGSGAPARRVLAGPLSGSKSVM